MNEAIKERGMVIQIINVARQRYRKAAAYSVALDHGDNGLGAIPDRSDSRAAACKIPLPLRDRSGIRPVQHRAEVPAGAEAVPRPAEDDHAHTAVRFKLTDSLFEQLHHCAVEGVFLPWPVERDPCRRAEHFGFYGKFHIKPPLLF